MSALYGLYYTILEPFAGLSWCAILGLPLLWSCHAFQEYIPYAWAYAIAAHFIGWFMQVRTFSSISPRLWLLEGFFNGLAFFYLRSLSYKDYSPRFKITPI